MQKNAFTSILSAAIMVALISGFVLVRAQEDPDFSTDYDTVYDIQENGEALVTQNIAITNLKSDVIATTYSINIKQINVHEPKESDKDGELEIHEEKTPEGTTLKIQFNSFTIGEGRQNNLSISYKTKDIASKVGKVWNINIPRTLIAPSTTTYNLRLHIPESFGNKLFISPNPTIEENGKNKRIYHFSTGGVKNKNISANFGSYQMLNFKILYQLENPNLLPANYEVALPPEISSVQQIKYENIQPQPAKIFIDKDGNTIARFRLKPEQKLEVTLIGSSKLLGKQIIPGAGGAVSEIPNTIISKYTKEKPFWEKNADNIKAVSKKLFDKNSNVTQNAQKIYNFLIEEYSYDFGIASQPSVERKGAQKAIDDKSSWGCMEFTDSFIAIARAMGIPAREINGYAITNDEVNKPLSVNLKGGDFLHAWPEFYDPNLGWVQVDPTWGDTSNSDFFTKLDTNHFTFSIKGLSSEYPLPAGSYRFDSLKKLVEVDYAQNEKDPEFVEQVQIRKGSNYNILQKILGREKHFLKNTGAIIVYDLHGNPIAPGETRVFYLKTGLTEIKLKNFNSQEIVFPLT